ncbi:MAG: ribonuclease N1 [Actinobacteria bacterium]|nr:ribonuclease N1 [Actinomycetota bacterium]
MPAVPSRPSFRGRPHLVIGAFLALAVLAVVVFALLSGSARTDTPPASATTVSASANTSTAGLPAEVGRTLRLIRAGGPFPYARDGVVFQNRERRLPRRPGGYYREYTVPTPGSRDRGPRRIIRGSSDEFWYSPDHYGTFRRLS